MTGAFGERTWSALARKLESDGGVGYAWEVNLPEVTVTPSGNNSYNTFYWGSSGRYAGYHGNYDASYNHPVPGGGIGIGYQLPVLSQGITTALDGASVAIANAGLWTEVYGIAHGYTPVPTAIANLFDVDPLNAALRDLDTLLKQNPAYLKGIAAISLAGKIVGVTSTMNGFLTLANDYSSGKDIFNDPQARLHLIDACVGLSSLFIKSNIVGFAVSTGWLLIKANMETPASHPGEGYVAP